MRSGGGWGPPPRGVRFGPVEKRAPQKITPGGGARNPPRFSSLKRELFFFFYGISLDIASRGQSGREFLASFCGCGAGMAFGAVTLGEDARDVARASLVVRIMHDARCAKCMDARCAKCMRAACA